MFKTLASTNMNFTNMIVEPEPALVRAARIHNDILVNVVGPCEHVVDAENLIMVLKNIMRCIIHELPWPLPTSMVPMRRRNEMITETTGVIPLEAASGAKVNFEFEFGVGFGDSPECYVRSKKTNQMIERTVTAVPPD